MSLLANEVSPSSREPDMPVYTTTEEQAQILNDIQSNAQQLRSYLLDVQKQADHQVSKMASGMVPDASWVINPATRAVEYQTKVQTLINVALMLKIEQAQILQAYSEERVFFTAAEEI